MKFLTSFLVGLFLVFNLTAQLPIELESFQSGFNDPVDLAHAGDDRLFVVEQGGLIKIIDGNGNTLSENFLNSRPLRIG